MLYGNEDLTTYPIYELLEELEDNASSGAFGHHFDDKLIYKIEQEINRRLSIPEGHVKLPDGKIVKISTSQAAKIAKGNT